MTDTSKENKMGTMPVTKLIINMSLPIMLSMLVQAFYNIVDSVFVSRLHEDALAAVSLAFPIQTMIIAVGVGTAVGVNAYLAMKLGEKDQEAVNSIALNGLFLAFCSFIIFFLIGTFCVKPYFSSQTDNERIIRYGSDYLKIVLMMSFGAFFGIMLDRLLQATGRTFYTMITQLIGAVTNIILDPILIFGIGPFPRMEMAGAALATVIGQILGACFSVYFNVKKNPDIHFMPGKFRPDMRIIGSIYRIGFPSILMQTVNSFTTFGMNVILSAFSSTAVAVYGVYFKLNSFVFMPLFGLTTGMVPIISYNFGAKNRKRITSTIKKGLGIALCIMSVGIILFETIPGKLLSIFNASEDMLAIGIPALRIIAPSFFGAAIAITFGTTFQALGRSILSMTVSFIRQIFVLLPFAWLFARTGIISNVWYCFLVAEIFAISLSIIFMLKLNKKVLNF